MRRNLRGALGALLGVGIALALAVPAAAQTSGNETFSGVIVTSGLSGERVVVTSVVVAKGVFSGAGRVVEIPNLPTDPDNVSRDDLVFADGSIHIISTLVDFSASENGQSCHFNATVQQTIEVVGGTGRFAAASGSFTGTVGGPALFARNPDGSCSFEQAALHEVDMFAMSGTLSF
jgi:hypothetical protein